MERQKTMQGYSQKISVPSPARPPLLALWGNASLALPPAAGVVCPHTLLHLQITRCPTCSPRTLGRESLMRRG